MNSHPMDPVELQATLDRITRKVPGYGLDRLRLGLPAERRPPKGYSKTPDEIIDSFLENPEDDIDIINSSFGEAYILFTQGRFRESLKVFEAAARLSKSFPSLPLAAGTSSYIAYAMFYLYGYFVDPDRKKAAEILSQADFRYYLEDDFPVDAIAGTLLTLVDVDDGLLQTAAELIIDEGLILDYDHVPLLCGEIVSIPSDVLLALREKGVKRVFPFLVRRGEYLRDEFDDLLYIQNGGDEFEAFPEAFRKAIQEKNVTYLRAALAVITSPTYDGPFVLLTPEDLVDAVEAGVPFEEVPESLILDLSEDEQGEENYDDYCAAVAERLELQNRFEEAFLAEKAISRVTGTVPFAHTQNQFFEFTEKTWLKLFDRFDNGYNNLALYRYMEGKLRDGVGIYDLAFPALLLYLSLPSVFRNAHPLPGNYEDWKTRDPRIAFYYSFATGEIGTRTNKALSSASAAFTQRHYLSAVRFYDEAIAEDPLLFGQKEFLEPYLLANCFVNNMDEVAAFVSSFPHLLPLTVADILAGMNKLDMRNMIQNLGVPSCTSFPYRIAKEFALGSEVTLFCYGLRKALGRFFSLTEVENDGGRFAAYRHICFSVEGHPLGEALTAQALRELRKEYFGDPERFDLYFDWLKKADLHHLYVFQTPPSTPLRAGWFHDETE